MRYSSNNKLIIFNSNTLPSILTNPKEINDFIKEQNNILNIEKSMLNSQNISSENYNKLFEHTQKHAELILDAELILAEKFKNINTQQGSKTANTKEKIINGWGFSKKQYINMQNLTDENVKEAKKIARNEGKIVVQNDALKILKDEHKAKNNVEFTQQSGIYETIDLPTHNPERIANPINYCVLFANVGIGEYYLEKNGFHAAVANEYLPERAKWYKELYPNCNVIVGDINEKVDEIVDAYKEAGCRMLLASPPCQTFTNAGKRDFTDKRTSLFIPTLEIIKRARPEYIVIENVKEFLTASPENLKDVIGNKSIGDYICDKLKSLGYTVNVDVCNAADYGTAQSRERAIFLASLNGLWKFPKKDKFRIPLFEVIGDWPSIEAGEKSTIHPLHYAPTLPQCQIDFLRHTPSGCSAHNNKGKWKPVNIDGSKSQAKHEQSFTRKDWGKPSSTITSDCIGISGHNTVHPGRPMNVSGCDEIVYSDARVLSILELLRITGLPDNYPIPTWARSNEKLMREVIAECFAPRHVERLMTTLPKPLALTYNK